MSQQTREGKLYYTSLENIIAVAIVQWGIAIQERGDIMSTASDEELAAQMKVEEASNRMEDALQAVLEVAREVAKTPKSVLPHVYILDPSVMDRLQAALREEREATEALAKAVEEEAHGG